MSPRPDAKLPLARADRLLANLGYGSRREVQALIEQGAVTFDGQQLRNVGQHLPISEALVERVKVRDQPLDPPAPLTLIMHKPLGLVCSHREEGRSIYELLPTRWRSRDPVLSSIGRLDADTTGLLLITDDGGFLHRVISPKSSTPKEYEVTLAKSLTGAEAELFLSGRLILEGDDKPLAPAFLEPLTQLSARLTITEGRYHQVRRMFSALGNSVVALHRSSIGALRLPTQLGPGAWRILARDEQQLVAPN